jgi:hypothetical protein
MTQEQSVYPNIALYVSISASQSVSRNSEGHMKSVQPMKCMLFYSDMQYSFLFGELEFEPDAVFKTM